MTSDALIATIRQLPDEVALEAAQLFATSQKVVGPSDDDPALALAVIAEAPAHQADLADAARLLLLLAAAGEGPEESEAARRAIEGAGHKQFVLGGAELVALAIVMVGAYRLHLTKGRKRTHVKRTETTAPDGARTIVIDEVVEYETSGPVADLVTAVAGP